VTVNTIGYMAIEVVYVPFIDVRVFVATVLPISCQRWTVGHVKY